MNFEQFINSLINAFNNTFTNLTKIFEIVMQNNYIKLIIFIVLFYLFIEFADQIFILIKNIFSMKKAAGKNKQNSNTDIE